MFIKMSAKLYSLRTCASECKVVFSLSIGFNVKNAIRIVNRKVFNKTTKIFQ